MTTFETKVYEKDWEYILKGNYLKKIIERCNYNFAKKIIFINNVNDKNIVKKYADEKVQQGVLDAYYFVDDYAEAALKFFNIDKDSFKGGYYYSISELVSIYLCETEYLLHFSSDSYLMKTQYNWIDEAIKIFKKRNDIIVANPTWNKCYNQAEKESFSKTSNFFIGFGFSDQCYLIKLKFFKNDIYNTYHDSSERYPKYGGELFEKRVDSYMRNNNLYRITSSKISYIHQNFPKKNYFKWLNKLGYVFFVQKNRLLK